MSRKPTSGAVLGVVDPSSNHDAAAGLAERYRQVRGTTERLCAPLEVEDHVVQSMPDASPARWHLAHTTWFYETFVLATARPGYQPYHPQYGFLFNSYYNAIGERVARPLRGTLSRPTVAEVYRYRAAVDGQMLDLLERARPAEHQAVESTIILGLNHEQQHQELILTDIKHAFGTNPVHPEYTRRGTPGAALAASSPLCWVSFPGGVHEVGHSGLGFAFDNELPRHPVYVNEFRLASRPVTNHEYLEFMADRGYHRPELWLSDGWDARRAQGWECPLYWQKNGAAWDVFTLHGLRTLDPHEPVCHVSYYEADAYARWAGARLATEAEWEVAAAPCALAGNFLESHRLHPAPAGADLAAGSAVSQLLGDVWEWTQSPYTPYPGYRPAPGALGEYNGKFMCNQYVLRGGSCATPQSHIRATYRNFFPPAARWQFTGIRLASDV